MSSTPGSAFLQKSIRQTIKASATSLRQHLNCVRITEYALEASDESLELACHTGELALRRCLLDRVASSPLAKRPCGYLKMMEAEIFSASALALLVTMSDLNAAATKYNAVSILFSRPSSARPTAPISHTRRLIRNCLRIVRESEKELVESRLSRVRQTVSTVCASVSQEVDEFMVYARRFPQAFMTGFNSALSSADPQPPTLKVVEDPSPGPLRTPSRSPSHINPKPYLRANAPSPPSRNHRLAPRRRSQPILSSADPESSLLGVIRSPRTPSPRPIRTQRVTPRPLMPKPYLRAGAPSPPSRTHRPTPRVRYEATSDPQDVYFPVSLAPRLPPYTSGPCYSSSTPATVTFRTTFSPPPVFAPPGGPNRTLVFNPAPSSGIPHITITASTPSTNFHL
ncbi:hypothetical protein K438DRAFT_1755918 [Mycena galopus ATCC 62051]|nr:hypothetical protein K438DRAFT_1755918 [Mycena galopus ATCC 62051]